MKRRTSVGFVGAFTVFLACCAPQFFPPGEKEMNVAKQKFETVSMDDLSQGYKVYTSKCGSCHVLYQPERFTEEKWRIDIPEMSTRAKLTETEQAQLLKYILTQRETNLQAPHSK